MKLFNFRIRKKQLSVHLITGPIVYLRGDPTEPTTSLLCGELVLELAKASSVTLLRLQLVGRAKEHSDGK
ncbi:hypothetical protein BC936DRAFT_147160 [Jimgerdemannia flammicorona]|nr:hypothetical protein BC936DRAFT_147160 [Jimgerdemannia flammicorona]